MSRYSDYVERLTPKIPIVPTDWDYVRGAFGDILDGEILAGIFDEPDRYPNVRKTIRIKDKGVLYAREYVHDRKGTAPYLIQFEYDWYYNSNGSQASWKFHYDTYHSEKYLTSTKDFHEHDQPSLLKSEQSRLPNYCHRDICSILSSIRFFLRVKSNLP